MTVKLPLTHTASGPWRTLINDADGNTIGEIKGGVFYFELWDDRPGGYKVGAYSTWDDAWRTARAYYGDYGD